MSSELLVACLGLPAKPRRCGQYLSAPQTQLPPTAGKAGEGTLGAPRIPKVSLGTTCYPAVTGQGILLTCNHFIHSVRPISEMAKSRLKKYSVETASQWHSKDLNLFLPGSKPSPPDCIVFYTPDSELDTRV